MDSTTSPTPTKNENRLSLPVAIIVAGALIAGAIYLSQMPKSATPTGTTAQVNDTIAVQPITTDDHFLGNPDAPITLIEFSDLECPYCKMFHATMNTLMDEYGKNGTLAWVYRHFPLAQLHPTAPRKSEAVECVNELSNKTATWNFINRLFVDTPQGGKVEDTQMFAIATQLGIKKDALTACLDSGKYTQKVSSQLEDAVKAGGRGTPFSVLVLKNEISKADENAILQQAAMLGAADLIVVDKSKKIVSLSGALPVDFMKQIITTITQ